jgi:predicted nucleic acid-binding protein
MKVVYDTCLYVDLLRSAARLALFTDRSQIRYLSPVVLMELMAGARTPQQRKVVDRLLKPYSKAHRIIHLGANLFYKAGQCLARMGRHGIQLHKGLTHDLLIALSAASIGATLFTGNKKDFERIGKFVDVEMRYV